MFRKTNPTRPGLTGVALVLSGIALLLGVYLLFDRQWLAALETGRLDFLEFLGWYNFFGYAAIGLVVVGTILLLVSFARRRG
ncbi:MAG: hypothetical protein RJA14_624 [Pseudomonadota bacterium]|jgi:hypothetical protein